MADPKGSPPSANSGNDRTIVPHPRSPASAEDIAADVEVGGPNVDHSPRTEETKSEEHMLSGSSRSPSQSRVRFVENEPTGSHTSDGTGDFTKDSTPLRQGDRQRHSVLLPMRQAAIMDSPIMEEDESEETDDSDDDDQWASSPSTPVRGEEHNKVPAANSQTAAGPGGGFSASTTSNNQQVDRTPTASPTPVVKSLSFSSSSASSRSNSRRATAPPSSVATPTSATSEPTPLPTNNKKLNTNKSLSNLMDTAESKSEDKPPRRRASERWRQLKAANVASNIVNAFRMPKKVREGLTGLNDFGRALSMSSKRSLPQVTRGKSVSTSSSSNRSLFTGAPSDPSKAGSDEANSPPSPFRTSSHTREPSVQLQRRFSTRKNSSIRVRNKQQEFEMDEVNTFAADHHHNLSGVSADEFECDPIGDVQEETDMSHKQHRGSAPFTRKQSTHDKSGAGVSAGTVGDERHRASPTEPHSNDESLIEKDKEEDRIFAMSEEGREMLRLRMARRKGRRSSRNLSAISVEITEATDSHAKGAQEENDIPVKGGYLERVREKQRHYRKFELNRKGDRDDNERTDFLSLSPSSPHVSDGDTRPERANTGESDRSAGSRRGSRGHHRASSLLEVSPRRLSQSEMSDASIISHDLNATDRDRGFDPVCFEKHQLHMQSKVPWYHRTIRPDSRYVYYWKGLLLAIILYNAFIIPFRLSFGFFDESIGAAFILEWLGDIVFILDIFLNFRLGYTEQGMLYMDRKMIEQKYMRSWFAVDVLVAAPFDFIQLGIGVNEWVRAPKLFRLLRILNITNDLEHVADLPVTTVKLIKLVLYLVLVSHFGACGWFGVVRIEGFGSSQWTDYVNLETRGIGEQYLVAFYWSWGLLAGAGDGRIPTTDLESMYQFLVMMVGIVGVAYLIGTIGSLLENKNEKKKILRQRLTYVGRFMDNYNLPSTLQNRIYRYYTYLWSRSRGFESYEFLVNLSDTLRVDVWMILAGNTVKNAKLFQFLDPGFVPSLVTRLIPVIYGPNEYIVREGDIGRTMYFIHDGSVEVIVDKKSVAKLRPGQSFGEYALLLERPRTASIKTKTFCELLVLNKADFEELLVAFPGSAREIYERTEHDRKRTIQKEKSFRLSDRRGKAGFLPRDDEQAEEGNDEDEEGGQYDGERIWGVRPPQFPTGGHVVGEDSDGTETTLDPTSPRFALDDHDSIHSASVSHVDDDEQRIPHSDDALYRSFSSDATSLTDHREEKTAGGDVDEEKMTMEVEEEKGEKEDGKQHAPKEVEETKEKITDSEEEEEKQLNENVEAFPSTPAPVETPIPAVGVEETPSSPAPEVEVFETPAPVEEAVKDNMTVGSPKRYRTLDVGKQAGVMHPGEAISDEDEDEKREREQDNPAGHNALSRAHEMSSLQSVTLERSPHSLHGRLVEKHRLFDPNSRFMKVWKALMWVVSMYNAIFVPFQCSFVSGDLPVVITFNVIGDLLLLADIFINMRLATLKGGIYETDVDVLSKRYFHSVYFMIDVLVSLPLDLGMIGTGWNPAWRLNKILKVAGLRRYLRSDYTGGVPIRNTAVALRMFSFMFI